MPEERASRPLGGREAGRPDRRRGRAHRAWYLLLLVPFIAVLIPEIYARESPELWGIPFFYWYMFSWIVLAAVLIAVVYRMTTPRERSIRAREEADAR